MVQRMRHTMGQKRVHTRPAREDLDRRDATRRGVAIVCCSDVAADLTGDPP